MQTSRHNSENERWVRNVTTAGTAGSGLVSAIAPGQRKASVLPAYVYDFLSYCSEFRTFGSHLGSYASHAQLEHEQLRDLQQWIPRLIESHLFVSERELLETLRAAPGEGREEDRRIAGLSIPTGNRPDRLARVAGTFLRNAAAHGHRIRCVVADNSTNAEALAGNAAALAELANELPHGIVHLDRTALERIAVALARRTGCAEAITRFGLLGAAEISFSCGANRNAGLLFFAGNTYLSADDDVSCELHGPGEEAMRHVLLFSRRDALLRSFYPSREAIAGEVKFDNRDLISAMESTVGKRFATCLNGRSASFGEIGWEFLQQLQRAEDLRVTTVFPGHVGDPGIPTSCYYLGFTGQNLRNLTRSEKTYAATMRNRAIRSMAPHLAIGDLSLTPGMIFALDASDLVPPFFPALHAEDFSWGAALARCCKGALGCHLPIAVHHDSGPGKTILTPGQLQELAPGVLFEFAHLLRHLISSWIPQAGIDSREQRMRELGRYLAGFASLSSAEFEEAIKVQVIALHSSIASYYEELAAEVQDAPDFWREDVHRYMEWQRRGLETDDFDLPVDLRSLREPRAARALMQSLIGRYGELLKAWPELFEAASEVREEFVR